jgi:hypothetical protein
MRSTNEQYFRFPRQLLTSPAFKALNLQELRVFFRIMEEHQARSGFIKEGLVVTRRNLVAAGIHPKYISGALLVLNALGIIKCTRNMGGSANGRTPNLYAPTFLSRDPKNMDEPTHEYLEITTLEEAERLAELHRYHEKRRDRIALPRMRKLQVASPSIAKL